MPKSGPRGKRSQQRVESAVRIRIRGVDVYGLEFEEFATALEVSRRGFSFLTPRNLAISTPLTVLIPKRGPSRPSEGTSDFLAEATVIRTSQMNKPLHRVAARFRGASLPIYSAENL